MTDLRYWENHQHNGKSHQHNDVTNITVTDCHLHEVGDLIFFPPTSATEVDVAVFLCGNFENCDHIVLTRIHDKCSVIVNCLNLWLSVISHFNYLRFTTFSFLQVQCNMSPLCGDNLRGITIIMVRDLITNIQTLFGPVDRGWITLLTLIQVLSYENHKSPRKKGWRSLEIILYKYIFYIFYYIILFLIAK